MQSQSLITSHLKHATFTHAHELAKPLGLSVYVSMYVAMTADLANAVLGAIDCGSIESCQLSPNWTDASMLAFVTTEVTCTSTTLQQGFC